MQADDRLSCQGLWTSGKVGLGLLHMVRGCGYVAQVEVPLVSREGRREAGERGWTQGCLSQTPEALQVQIRQLRSL